LAEHRSLDHHTAGDPWESTQRSLRPTDHYEAGDASTDIR